MTASLLTIDAAGTQVPVGTWVIDPAHSTVGFSVRHLMSKVRGTFQEFTGRLTTAESLSGCSAAATIAVSSVNTGNRFRDDDLRSANFFDVERYPELVFTGTSLVPVTAGFELPGQLTIRGITCDVVLAVEFLGLDETGLQGEQRIGISATATIRRSDHGVGGPAGEGAKIVVGDRIDIQLDIQAALTA